MEQGSQLELERPHDAPADPRPAGRLRRAGELAVLWLHRQADRMDLVPSEFGDSAPVDRDDGAALAREWWRQARLWAGYNPEQVLALKAGALALGIALLVLIALVGAIR